jgi:hypothetical protein
MSDEPKVFSLPASRDPTSLGSGNGHKPHFAPPSEIAHEEPKPNLKHALFYVAVESLLILSRRLGRSLGTGATQAHFNKLASY